MLVVVADTGPLRYLVLVGSIDVLPQLFDSVIMPDVVHTELRHQGAPRVVRDWAARPPSWLTVSAEPASDDQRLARLDPGERAAIGLACALRADLQLIDDRAGVVAASACGVDTIGAIGLLDRAARSGLIEIGPVIASLKATNFRYRPQLLDDVVARHRRDAPA